MVSYKHLFQNSREMEYVKNNKLFVKNLNELLIFIKIFLEM